jgi:hypothetical protein
MRAAIYARVSTERQERQQTIDSQLSALRGWVSVQNHVLADTHVFRDEGFSGSRLDRPALDALRACLSKQFQWVDRRGWVGGAHRLCAGKHWASTRQALFGSGPPPRAEWILRWRRNLLKQLTQTGSKRRHP